MKNTLTISDAEFTGFFHERTQEEGAQLPNRFFWGSFPFYWQITLLFFPLKVPLMHFNAIWLGFYSSLWFLHFLTTFFRPCQKAILRVNVWIDMYSGVTQVLSLLKLALCQVTSVSCAALCNVTFLFRYHSLKYITRAVETAVLNVTSWGTVMHILYVSILILEQLRPYSEY